jgi:hypothetical protein
MTWNETLSPEVNRMLREYERPYQRDVRNVKTEQFDVPLTKRELAEMAKYFGD